MTHDDIVVHLSNRLLVAAIDGEDEHEGIIDRAARTAGGIHFPDEEFDEAVRHLQFCEFIRPTNIASLEQSRYVLVVTASGRGHAQTLIGR